MTTLRPINRRNFIRRSGALISAFAALPVVTSAAMKTYKTGLQLFSVRDALTSDLKGSLKRIKSFGYEDLETYGFDGEQNSYYGMPSADYKKLLEDHQLTTSSGHYDFSAQFDKTPDALKRYVDQCITGAHALGQKYITWPWLDPKFRSLENFKLLTKKLNDIGAQVNQGGLGFAYHNHDFEFVDYNGENGYDIILHQTDPALVKLQVDLYWVMHSSKQSPQELFRKQPGRFVMWHIKDMDKITRDYTELGNGSIDFKPILPDASMSGMQFYFLEQGGHYAKNSMQSMEDNERYFKKNLEKYLA